jgi:hypothetical protein
MNESKRSKQDEQIEELLSIVKDMQEEVDEKEQMIASLKTQLNYSATLVERLNSENSTENLKALKSDLRSRDESLQSANEKLKNAEDVIGEYQDRLEKAEAKRQYAETHQRIVEVPVEKLVHYEKCVNCNSVAFRKEKELYEQCRKKLDGQYKAKTARFELTLFISCCYALMTTVFTALRSEVLVSDFVAFFGAIWAGICKAMDFILYAGKFASQAGDKIPNETAALAAHWLLFLAAIIAITAGVGVIIFLLARWIWSQYRENCLDVISVIVSVISIALIVYFGVEIKGMLRLNLICILLLVQALYVGVRSYVRGCKRARGYY